MRRSGDSDLAFRMSQACQRRGSDDQWHGDITHEQSGS
jgi:hypothetical protein